MEQNAIAQFIRTQNLCVQRFLPRIPGILTQKRHFTGVQKAKHRAHVGEIKPSRKAMASSLQVCNVATVL